MLPLLGILSALSLIDRSNLGLARATGMDHDLVGFFIENCQLELSTKSVTQKGLNIGSRYSIVSCIYFVPYIIL